MIYTKQELKKLKQICDSIRRVNDSDKLKQLAYRFAQMGNYFDRANSSNSRNILAREDDKKYVEFYNLALEVYRQLSYELEQVKTHKDATDFAFELSETLKLINDGADRLYWIAVDQRDQKGIKLREMIREKAEEFQNYTAKR